MSSLGFYCCDILFWPKESWRVKGLFYLTYHNPFLREVRQGAEMETKEEHCLLACSHGLFVHPAFCQHSGPPAQRWQHLQWLTLPHQSTNLLETLQQFLFPNGFRVKFTPLKNKTKQKIKCTLSTFYFISCSCLSFCLCLSFIPGFWNANICFRAGLSRYYLFDVFAFIIPCFGC